jgi:hypothetical protein
MALRQSDIQIHNNPNLAVVDSDFVKGGFRTAVGSVNDLYALSGKTDEPSAAGQVKEYATIVYVTGDSKYYVLKDVSNIDNPAGWEEFASGGAGTLTGATNGLSLFSSGTSVGLGSPLTQNTTICLGSGSTYYSLRICDDYQTGLFLDPANATVCFGGTDAISCVSGAQIEIKSDETSSPNQFSMFQALPQQAQIYAISGSGYSTIVVEHSGITVCTLGEPNFTGIQYDEDYSLNYVARSIPDVGWVTGYTSGITGTITGGTNGLGYINKDVCLGGSLLNDTTINPNGYNLNLSGTTGSISSFIGTPTSYSCASVSISCVSLEKVSTTNWAYIDITGTSITTCSKGGNLNYNTNGNMIITAPSGATYTGCYHNNYTDRTLVDKEYVDNSKSHVCVVVTDADPYYITGLDIVYVGVSGVTEDRVYLPSGTSLCIGRKITIADVCGEALTNRIIIDGAGKNINNTGCAVINTDYGSITLLYNGYFWSPISFVN